ncbi:MAG: methyltransferase family protein [Nitrospinales bacterium]
MDKQKKTSSLRKLILDISIPSLYLIPLLAVYFSHPDPKTFGFHSDPVVYAGLGLGMAGLIIWILSMWNLGGSLAVLPGADRLVTRGLYKHIRHPIYLGITLTLFGLMLAVGSLWGILYVLFIVIPVNIVRARLEDKKLLAQFGETYKAYCEKTRSWIPIPKDK